MKTKLSLLEEVGLFARANCAPPRLFRARGLLKLKLNADILANSSWSGIELPAPGLLWLLAPEWLFLGTIKGLVRGLENGLESGLAKGLVWLCLRTISTFCRHSVTLGD